ncbi:ECF-type sigma factor [Pseudolysobacter antarcticus]|nr:ECF-type sigma factor [Pseudolysobacter antarcticus]
MSEITVLLDRARGGDHDAWNAVIELLYEDLKRLARARGDGSDGTLSATGLVNECYMRLAQAGSEKDIIDRGHFLALAARVMRQVVIGHARKRLADKRGGHDERVTLSALDSSADIEAGNLISIDAALEHLATIDARYVQLVECRVFGGLSEEETALAIDLPLRSTQRLWHKARESLRRLLDR